MGYFPFFVELDGKAGVVIGGGKVAARKVELLLDFGPRLTVIAPALESGIWELKERIEIRQKSFQPEDLEGADFVIAATDDREINARVSAYCRERKIPVNAVDDRENCTFFFPALVKEGPLTVGISTEGKSPAAASWIRRQVAGTLPENIGGIIDLMGQIRPWVLERIKEESHRRELFEKMFVYCVERDCRGDGEKVTAEELQALFLK